MGRGKRQQGGASPQVEVSRDQSFTDAVYALNDATATANPEVFLELVPSGEVGVVYFEVLVVRPVERGQGKGSRVLRAVCDEADRRGWTLRLSPQSSGLDGRDRLARLYARFGFAFDGENSELMERPPGRLVTDPLLERATNPEFVEEGHFDSYLSG
jgi:GNAT superfamily N-acetyltransferase